MSGLQADIMINGVLKTVQLSQPEGVGSLLYDVMIDNYYYGRIWQTEHFGWQHDIRQNSGISADDRAMLIEGLMNL